jgi:hypothetical protein
MELKKYTSENLLSPLPYNISNENAISGLLCYKNILQVKMQREFKVTPDYMEINQYNTIIGYHMGVYLCLGQPIHDLNHSNSIPISNFSSSEEIHEYMSIHGKVLVSFAKS